MSTSGTAPFKARARLMLLLGEQLITNEVVAVFELVKNSYDADATIVNVTLNDVSAPSKGEVVVEDNGIGMDKDTLLKSWLELGTLGKARLKEEYRRSPGGRPYLGEKGIGRLAVHKLGHKTELVSRAANSSKEVKLTVDWSDFENSPDQFLESIPVKWEEREPQAFNGNGVSSHGTRISITNLQTRWTKNRMLQLHREIEAMTSPFAGLKNFNVKLNINDPERPKIEPLELFSVVESATYKFAVTVSHTGQVTGTYKFFREDQPQLARELSVLHQVYDPKQFPIDLETRKPRIPECGPFSFRLYVWDLYQEDKEAVFKDASIYDRVIKPNTGVRVFRDGFRVLPYGDVDDDWLGLDARRVTRFENNISRNMEIGLVDMTSKDNPLLRDKSDREGLISNQAFGDFRALLLGAIKAFEALRVSDRGELKKLFKRTRERQIERIRETLDKVNDLIHNMATTNNQEALSQIKLLLDNAQGEIIDVIEDAEQPLLVAAAIGITYMIPTHEVKRDLQEIKRILGRAVKELPDGKTKADLNQAWRLSFRADELVEGIAKILRKGRMTDLTLDTVANEVRTLLNEQLTEENIKITVDARRVVVRGSERLLTVVLLNLVENSIYWLKTKDPAERKIRVVADYLKDGSPFLLVSDNGPGLEGEFEDLVKPFISKKPDGMGLGLYIANQIAQNHGGRLRTFGQSEVPGLLEGANVGIVFPKVPDTK